jgi:two-component system NtrC family sensor kinase
MSNGSAPAGAPRRARRARASFLPLWTGALGLPVLAFAAGAWWSWTTVEQEARGRLARSVDMLHEHALRAFEVQEALLAAIEARIGGLDWPTIAASAELWAFLAELDRRTPTIAALGLVDPMGRMVVSSRAPAFPMVPADVSDRDYVRAALAELSAGRTRDGAERSVIGEVVTSRPTGLTVFPFARPRLDAAGTRDGGVLVVAFPSSAFADFYASIAESPGDVITLARLDGAVLARHPATSPPSAGPASGAASGPGEAATAALLAATLAGGQRQGLQRVALGGEGGSRLVAVRRVAGYPAAVVHALDPAVLRAAWLPRLGVLGAICAGAGVLLATLIAAARHSSRRAEHALGRAATEAELARAAAEARANAEQRMRQAERSAALGQVTAGVAHDMNNLVQGVLAASRLLDRRAAEPAEVRRIAAMLGEAAARGQRLAYRMLEFSRPASRTEDSFDLAASLEGLDALLGGLLGSGVRLAVSAPAGLPMAAADRREFETVLVNLAVNARDAMPRGGEVRVAATLPLDVPPGLRRSGPWLRVAVVDSGEGMTAEVRRRAGEPFFTTKPAGQGTGLGLMMARQFAERAGGMLEIESEPGQGTTVALWLPAAPAAELRRTG